MEEANKLIGLGKKHLVMGQVVEAVNSLQEACGMLAKKYGDTADECGEAMYWCGKALLDLARMENSVLGNALEGVPEEEEEKLKDSNVEMESTESLDEKARDELRVQVYDAMAEKPEDAEKNDSTPEKSDDVKEKTDSTSEVTKNNPTEKEEDCTTTEKQEPQSAPAEGEVENKTKSPAKEDSSKEAKEDSSKEAKAKEDSSKEAKEDSSKEAKEDSSKEAKEDSSKEAKEDSSKEAKEDSSKEAKEDSSKEDSSKEDSSKEDSSKEASQEKATDGDCKDDASAEAETEGTKANEAGEDDVEEEGEADSDEEMDDGEADDKAEGEDTAEKGSDDEEEVGNLQLAWEMLEVAKVIYKRKDTKDDQLMAAQAHLKLGEVAAESGNYTQAIEDFKECLTLQLKHLESDSRLLAETHYQLGLTYNLNSQYKESIEELGSSLSVIKSRLGKLQDLIDKAEGPDSLADERKEMEELKALLPEIQEKVEDSSDGLKNANKDAKGVLDKESTSETGEKLTSTKANEACEQATASDISHLVRKKRKPEESPVKEVKKVKPDDAQTNCTKETKSNGHSSDHTNGQSAGMEVESN
ncbi:unnamed protein product [Knipowitschia caucasica]